MISQMKLFLIRTPIQDLQFRALDLWALLREPQLTWSALLKFPNDILVAVTF